MKKRILGLILTLAMVLACMPIIAYAQTSGTCGENLTWTLDDEGTLTISGTGDMTYFGSDTWKENKASVTNVVIEDGVTSICDYAFYNCESITDVTIPASVKEIGEHAFECCTNLKSLNIPDGVEKIGEYAFEDCRGLTSVNIPSSVINIGDCVFADCDLEKVEVDENNKNYMSEDGVLYNKNKTEIILYPSKKSGTSYTIPDGVTSIAIAAFEDCVDLESVDIPASVKEIDNCAFMECINLTSLTIPEGITRINAGMVVNCEKLTSINIPESVNSISFYVFDGTAYYNDESNWTDDVLYIDNCLIEAMDTLSGDYQIKDGTRVIAEDALYHDDGVTGISIPESVIGIGSDAFSGTAFYEDETNWDNDVLYIDNCLIEAKHSLTGYYWVKDETRLIAEEAFLGCNYITGIDVPKSVKHINRRAFDGSPYPTVNYVFESPIAPTLGKEVFQDSEFYRDKKYKISVHKGYTGYTEENGYPADKIVVEPHDFADGVCSICGARETVPPIERIDESTDAKYAFRVNLGQEYENSYVYAAVYDAEGVLVSVNCVPLEMTGDTVISLDKSENDMTAKVFVWTDELQPILETAEEFPLNN